jgi:hypothetical protein
MQMSYWRFAAMIATSTLVMFGLMYIHTFIWDHVFFSETRAWMAVLMGAVMAIIMLAFMLNMYKNRAVNAAIFVGAGLVFALSTWLVRAQVTVDGSDYMQAMIPHHSIAILTSERAGIEDPRVRKLADEIIAAQRKEIAEMKYLIRALDREGPRAGVEPSRPADDAAAADAVNLADVAKADLEPLTGAEMQRMLGSSSVCRFAYSPDSAPVAAATPPGDSGAGRGVIKIHGRLVEMTVQYPSAPQDGFQLSGGDVMVGASTLDAAGTGEPRAAEARLRIGQTLEVGYDGFYGCGQ